MTRYTVEFSAVGRGIATVEADSQEEAEQKAKDGDFVLHSDQLLEWEYDEINFVSEESE